MTAAGEADTDGDALAAQVRRIPPLEPAEVVTLLAQARTPGGEPARLRLIEHHLDVALAAAIDRPAGGPPLDEAFQEASAAVVEAVAEYLRGGGGAEGLRAHLTSAARAGLAAEAGVRDRRRREDERLAQDAEALEAALFTIRRRTGRPATAAEAAEALEWPAARVAALSEIIAAARARYDEEISAYVDDED